ncbi:MAG TPA: hypothetical protein PK686_00655 [bacterium]|nr:hypothetical protein [bacterium]HPV65179.1 hypothetical protein [bacterium]
MFENIFNRKKETSSVLEVDNYKVLLKEKNIVDKNKTNENEFKSLLADVINSPELHIYDKKGDVVSGYGFDTVRDIVSREINGDGDKIKKIKEALSQNRFSYTRVHQFLSLLDSLDNSTLKDKLKNDYFSLEKKYLPSENKSIQYVELDMNEKKEFMDGLDKIAIELYNKL